MLSKSEKAEQTENFPLIKLWSWRNEKEKIAICQISIRKEMRGIIILLPEWAVGVVIINPGINAWSDSLVF